MSGGLAAASEAFEKQLVFPTWVWLTLGLVLLFVTACKLEWDLLKEREKNRTLKPTITLRDVIARLIANDDLPPSTDPRSMDVLNACEMLRESALLGEVAVFGGIDWRKTRPADYDRMVRDRIPARYWTDHKLDVVGILGDPDWKGRTTNMRGETEADDYYGIWFDREQIDTIWPPPRRRLRWQRPFRLQQGA